MNYFVEKTCTFRFDGRKSVYLEAGRQVEVQDGIAVPPWFVEVKMDSALEDPSDAVAVPDTDSVPDIRSKKDVCAELDTLNVVYSKKLSIKQLEDLLVDAKRMRAEKQD